MRLHRSDRSCNIDDLRVKQHPGYAVAPMAFALLIFALPGLGNESNREILLRDDRKLDLYISSEFEPGQRQELTAWINFISGALADVYGHWPRRQWQISIVPASAADSDPIPWAQVHRDTINRVEFYTAPQATTEELKQAWTGYHELAHLLIPYQGWGETWFSEGLASYYQNILQARSGMLTEQQTWQKLYEGFMRGRADSQFDGQSLTTVNESMREKGGFMRVYWSGAWYFLTIDVRLRQQSGGKHTLDLALQKLNDCCADDRLSVSQMVSKLDQMNEVLLFQPLYEQVKASTQVPAFEKTFASLGVTVVEDTVHLQQEGPGARLRQQVIRPNISSD
jgi:hypothetical protein